MPLVANLPTTSGTVVESYPERGKRKVIIERCSLTADTAFFQLQSTLPARHQLIATSIKTVSAVTIENGGSTNTGTSVLCERLALCKGTAAATIPVAASGTSTTKNGIIIGVTAPGPTQAGTNQIIIAAATSDTNVAMNFYEIITNTNVGGTSSAFDATSTAALTLFLVPIDGGTATSFIGMTAATEVFNLGTNVTSVVAAATNGYNIASTGTVDVQIWYDDLTTVASA